MNGSQLSGIGYLPVFIPDNLWTWSSSRVTSYDYRVTSVSVNKILVGKDDRRFFYNQLQ